MSYVRTMSAHESSQEKTSENKTLEEVLIEKVSQTREESNRSMDLEFLEEKNKTRAISRG